MPPPASVYGANTRMALFPCTRSPIIPLVPVCGDQNVRNELMAHKLLGLVQDPHHGALRFFTVYGAVGQARHGRCFLFPRGTIFSKASPSTCSTTSVHHKRDFHFRGGTSREGVVPPPLRNELRSRIRSGAAINPDPARQQRSFPAVQTSANNSPVQTHALQSKSSEECSSDAKAVKNFLPLQPGDVARDLRGISTISCGERRLSAGDTDREQECSASSSGSAGTTANQR